ncbi:MAG: hypothetical protein WCG85_14310, partial [Polyangia bacterium]
VFVLAGHIAEFAQDDNRSRLNRTNGFNTNQSSGLNSNYAGSMVWFGIVHVKHDIAYLQLFLSNLSVAILGEDGSNGGRLVYRSATSRKNAPETIVAG